MKRFWQLVSGPTDTDRFERLGCLGSGGEGSVELLWDRQLRRHVACKQLHQSGSFRIGSEVALDVARRLASITGNGVPRVLQLLRRNGQDCLLIEYTEGVSLEVLRSREALVWGDIEILRFTLGLARAVKRLHQSGVVHGDLSPANVLVDSNGSIRLVDFGQAAAVGQCLSGAITPGFSAPEYSGGVAADPCLDVYAIGALLQWLLNLSRSQTSSLPALSRVNDMINSSLLHATLQRCVEVMLSPLPEHRPKLDDVIAEAAALERQVPASAQSQWVADVRVLADDWGGFGAAGDVQQGDPSSVKSGVFLGRSGECVGDGAGESSQRTAGNANEKTSVRGLCRQISCLDVVRILCRSRHISIIAALLFIVALLLAVMITATSEVRKPDFAIYQFEVAAVTRLPIALDRTWLLSRLHHHSDQLGSHLGMPVDLEGDFELSVVCMGQVCQLGLWRSNDPATAHQSLVLAGSGLALWDGALRDLLRLALLPLTND